MGASNSIVIRVRAIDAFGQYSGYLVGTFTNPSPGVPQGLSASQFMNGIKFSWNPALEDDIDYWAYRIKIENESWEGWQKTTVPEAFRFLDADQAKTYDGATIYIEVIAYDTFGNSSGVSSTNGETGSLRIPKTALSDFTEISGVFTDIPILRDFVWQSDTPSAGRISWGPGYIYYNNIAYSISGGNTEYHWVYWVPTNNYLSSAEDDSAIPSGSFPIAVNDGGSYKIIWNNAIANQVIGSAWIRNLHGNKIVVNSLTALQINGAGFGNLTISSGTITIQTVDGLVIGGSGNIKVEAGNDINLVGAASDPGKINFIGTSYGISMGLNAAGTVMEMLPDTSGVIDLYIGRQDGGILFGSAVKYNDIQIIGNDQVYLQTGTRTVLNVYSYVRCSRYVGSPNIAFVEIYASSVTYGAAVVLYVNESSKSFRPTGDNSISCGASGYRWTAVWAVNGTIQTSDERFKEEIRSLNLGLDFILKLNPISFKPLGTNEISRKVGFSAQQIQNVLNTYYPGDEFSAIHYDDKEDIYGINYGEFVPPIVKSIQEINMRLNILENKI